MYVVFFIFLFVLLLITFPLFFEFYFKFNINDNNGKIIVKLFKIAIINYSITYKNRQITLYNKKDIMKLDFIINKQKIDFVNTLQKEIFKRIFLDKVYVNFEIGAKNNPFFSAMIAGLIKSIINILYGVISFQKPTSNLYYKINTYNDKNMGILNLNIIFSISMFNIITAYFKTKKYIANNYKELYKIERSSRKYNQFYK